MGQAYVHSLHIYPVKSCAAVDLAEARFDDRGFAGDRQWMLIKPDGTKITQREEPRLALIRPVLTENKLTLFFPNAPELIIDRGAAGQREISVEIWDDRCLALDEGEKSAEWITAILGLPARLVKFPASTRRLVDSFWSGSTFAEVTFVDSFPLLITSLASLDALNQLRLEQGHDPCKMSRFRPNIVLSGIAAFEEDSLPALLLADRATKIEIIRPCARCPVVDIDQDTATRETKGNLSLLGRHRRFKNYKGSAGAMFGVHAISPHACGKTIAVGESLNITELSPGLPPIPRLYGEKT